MNTDQNFIARCDLPVSLYKQIIYQLYVYSTILFLVSEFATENKVQQIGSGIFVSIGNKYGILTAQHVADYLNKEKIFGISISSENKEEFTIVKKEFTDTVGISKPVSEKFGPDLAFISICDINILSVIKASRSFFPLEEGNIPQLSDDDLSNGLWFICGSPEVLSSKTESNCGYKDISMHTQFCWEVQPSKMFEYEKFDYIDFNMTNTENIPPTFGGVSGGGVWQIIVKQDMSKNFLPKDYILRGVVFFQDVSQKNERFIRSHCIKSLNKLISKVCNSF